MRSKLTFLKEFIAKPGKTGAVAPSSRHLAKRMVECANLAGVKTVVEFGPGTGSFTREILSTLSDSQKFFAIELNEVFAKHLQEQHPELTVYVDCVTNVGKLCEKEEVHEVDCVISGLPWAVFPEDLQDKILDAMTDVLKKGGKFVTFAYVHALPLPPAQRFKKKLKQHFSSVSRTRTVWRNFPPAVCYECVR